MPTSQTDAADPIATSVACPHLLTPPAEEDGAIDAPSAEARQVLVEDGEMSHGAGDNTARGMAYEQEMSMYVGHEDDTQENNIAQSCDEGDKEKAVGVEGVVDVPGHGRLGDQLSHDREQPALTGVVCLSPSRPCEGASISDEDATQDGQIRSPWKTDDSDRHPREESTEPSSSRTDLSSPSQASSPATQISTNPPPPPTHRPTTTPSHYPSTPAWDFTNTPQPTFHPSSLLRPGSKFTGSQQSDKQIYNVDVTLLTVDTLQSSLTGYLRICGLTEDHPTLTTFFTGEIIGGPSHKYTFRTRNPTWGATDKTDLIHWARFPAWRPQCGKEAKRAGGIDFDFPLDGREWWQQETVYMRWKEHFLVPDHRVRSIVGASFEGFYYACLNQVEGRVSGIYFHAKSERYQQLELKHVFDKGVCPSREFR